MKTKMSLRAWMFLKITPMALLAVYYWMCTRNSFEPPYTYIQTTFLAIVGGVGGSLIATEQKRDFFDEFAKENLKATDSVCLKIAYALMILVAGVCVVAELSGEAIGYFIMGSGLLLAFLRAIIFSIRDKKGM